MSPDDTRPAADPLPAAGAAPRPRAAPQAGSLRVRLLLATFVGLAIALSLTGLLLSDLFRSHVSAQFERTLAGQLELLATRLEVGPTGEPTLDTGVTADPLWHKPYSGLYWQIDRMAEDGRNRAGALRSRSLWDAELRLAADPLDDGAIHVHEIDGPLQSRLLALERTVLLDDPGATRWRLIVAADTRDIRASLDRFNGALAASLTAMGLLMGLAAFAQVHFGLEPLRRMRGALADVRQGRTSRLEGRFPAEVGPLVDDFNSVLEQDARLVERARREAGDLAHALKTPLAVIAQAAAQGEPADPRSTEAAGGLARLVLDQVAAIRRHVDWHLSRARRAASRPRGAATPVEPEIQALLRVMRRVHAARGLRLEAGTTDRQAVFAGERQDLHEMLGNLLDNACKWASSSVSVEAATDDDILEITVDDDGPGLADADRESALRRGVRLDESSDGSGLGLAIVDELAQSYGGALSLGRAPLGGTRARLRLPAATPAPRQPGGGPGGVI